MAVTFNSIPSGLRCPLFYAEVDNSQANITGNDVLSTLLVGQKLATGTAEHGSVLRVTSVSAAKDYFGRGSQLARMAELFFNNASVSSLYCIGLDEPEDGTAAEGMIKIDGTATESGYINLYVGATRVRCVVSRGSAKAAIATALINAVNSVGDLPVTAQAASTAGAEAAPATMTGKPLTVEGLVDTFKAISDGTVIFTVDGTEQALSSLDFSECTDMEDVAGVISAALEDVATVTWATDRFEVETVSQTASSSLAPVTAGSGGTDISTKLGLASSDSPVITQGRDAEDRTGWVSVIAKGKGDYANDVRLQLNVRGDAGGERSVAGISVEITPMAGGAGMPEITDAINAMGDQAYEFIGWPWTDADSLDYIGMEMDDTTGRWSYSRMLFGHVISAMRGSSPDPLNSLLEFGATRNDQHLTVYGLPSTFASPVYEVIGALCGQTSVSINAAPARPLQTLALTGITGAGAADRFILEDRQALLENGLATLTDDGTTVAIERARTTYQHNSYGDTDVSYFDSNTLFTLASLIRQIRTTITSRYGRSMLADDGTRITAGSNTVTPSMLKGEIIGIYRAQEGLLVENVDEAAAATVVERNADDPSRVDMQITPDLVNALRIVAVRTSFKLQ